MIRNRSTDKNDDKNDDSFIASPSFCAMNTSTISSSSSSSATSTTRITKSISRRSMSTLNHSCALPQMTPRLSPVDTVRSPILPIPIVTRMESDNDDNNKDDTCCTTNENQRTYSWYYSNPYYKKWMMTWMERV